MKKYFLNKNVIMEKVDDDYMMLLDNKLFQINKYGHFIIESLCNNEITLENFIFSEINNNKNINEKIISEKINLFVNELINKNILIVFNENGGNDEK